MSGEGSIAVEQLQTFEIPKCHSVPSRIITAAYWTLGDSNQCNHRCSPEAITAHSLTLMCLSQSVEEKEHVHTYRA